jgi:hypothetical protein
MHERSWARHLLVPLATGGAALALILPGCGSSGSSSSTASTPQTGSTTAKTQSGPTSVPTSTKASCGSSSAPTSEAAATATGDIPDNQQFLTYRNPAGGYSISYPEGWARSGNGSHVVFQDKSNTITINLSKGSQPTTATVAAQMKKAEQGDPCLAAGQPQQIKVGPNQAIKVSYSTKGAASPVTGQRPKIVVDRYVYSKGGKVAVVDLATPLGVDNVDAYRMISQSFRWG